MIPGIQSITQTINKRVTNFLFIWSSFYKIGLLNKRIKVFVRTCIAIQKILKYCLLPDVKNRLKQNDQAKRALLLLTAMLFSYHDLYQG